MVARLYEYARKGIEVERPERKVTDPCNRIARSSRFIRREEVEFRIRVACGKGTYIRTLAVQMGNCLVFQPIWLHLSVLFQEHTRKATAGHLDEVRDFKKRDRLNDFYIPLKMHFPISHLLKLMRKTYAKIVNGQVLPEHPLT